MSTRRSRLKALASLAVLAALATPIVACGGGDDNDGGGGSGGGGETTAETPAKLAFIGFGKSDEFSISIACGIEDEARRQGAEVEIQQPTDPTADSQTPILNAVAAREPDAIILGPVDSTAMRAPAKQAADAGAKIVLVDNPLEDGESFVSSLVHTDNKAGGEVAAEEMTRLTGGRGDVYTLDLQAGIRSTDARREGFVEGIEGTPGMTSVGHDFGGFSVTRNASVASAVLTREPNLAGMYGTNTFAGEGIATALRQAGKIGDVQAIGFDASPAQPEALRKGELQALITQKPQEIGRLAVQQALAAIAGEPTEREINTGVIVVTRDNIDDPDVTEHLYNSHC